MHELAAQLLEGGTSKRLQRVVEEFHHCELEREEREQSRFVDFVCINPIES